MSRRGTALAIPDSSVFNVTQEFDMSNKGKLCVGLLGFSLIYSNYASAITLLIGDVDGFGFASPNSYQNAQGGLPDTNGNGIIEPDEYLPDLDGNGHVHVGGHDEFDNRSVLEVASTQGAQWTDVSLERNYGSFGRHPADDVELTFDFTVPRHKLKPPIF